MRMLDGSTPDGHPKSTLNKRLRLLIPFLLLLGVSAAILLSRPDIVHGARSAVTAVDPGPRPLPANAGTFYSTLDANQKAIEKRLTSVFNEVNFVAGGGNTKTVGLGPRFNSNSCASCHAYPAVGGSSQPNNPYFGVFQLMGATNTMPFFITTNGPTIVARFPYQSDGVTPDGSVHELFTISNRTDAPGCTTMVQPDFQTAATNNNLIFRQTTPTFGEGLMELITETDIVNNMNSNLTLKQSLGISGHPNYGGDDGTINRFGWKAQVKSLIYFSGEAYTVEEGNSDEAFPNENDESIPSCLPPFPVPPGTKKTKGVPDDRVNVTQNELKVDFPGDLERFSLFMRFLAPPTPAAPTPSTMNGQTQFNNIGCVLCHTGSFTTPSSSIAALGHVQAFLFSDLLVHHMGPLLADNVSQGQAGGDEFRTAPLWGVGQRLFMLHDARTPDIVQAILDHESTSDGKYPDSEANAVIENFKNLGATDQQDLVNFLRSL